MTTTLFLILLIIGSIVVFIVSAVLLYNIFDDSEVGEMCATLITAIYILLYYMLTPSTEQWIENDYYQMLKDRPKCIDTGNVSLGCIQDYVEWQQDSIKKQHKYDSVKVKLENSIVKNVTITHYVKPDTSVSDELKTCVDQCWKFAFNSDIKTCQDECFKQKGDAK